MAGRHHFSEQEIISALSSLLRQVILVLKSLRQPFRYQPLHSITGGNVMGIDYRWVMHLQDLLMWTYRLSSRIRHRELSLQNIAGSFFINVQNLHILKSFCNLLSLNGYRLVLWNDATDMRLSFNGLSGLVINEMKEDRFQYGTLYAFSIIVAPRLRSWDGIQMDWASIIRDYQEGLLAHLYTIVKQR